MKHQPTLSLRPAPQVRLRALLFTGLASTLLLAAVLLWQDLAQLGLASPVLSLHMGTGPVQPGSVHSCQLTLTGISGDQPVALRLDLPAGRGLAFVPGSLQSPEPALGRAHIQAYAGTPHLAIDDLAWEDMDQLRFTVDVAIPEDFALVGQAFPLRAVCIQGQDSVVAEPVSLTVSLPLFTIEKYLVGGQAGAGQHAAYQVVVTNPDDGGHYRAATMRLEFTDLLHDDGATFDPASVAIGGRGTYGEPDIQGHILRIPDIEMAPGTALTIDYTAIFPREMTGDELNEATMRVGYTELAATALAAGSSFPVAFRYFEGEVKSERAFLRWETSREENNRGFSIEHSRDGLAFQAVGYVEGAGTSTVARAYAFRTPVVETGRHHYRLRQEDYDGGFTYSKRIELFNGLSGTHSWSIYPNPLRERAFINLEVMRQQPVLVTVWDQQGRKVRTLFKGDMEPHLRYQFPFDAGSLAPGTYIIRAEGADFRDSHKVQLAGG